MNKFSKQLSFVAFVIVAFITVALSLKSTLEPDIWWMLQTGEWIVQHHDVPQVDVFSYTYNGATWINVKWLFEVVLYFLQTIGGPEFCIVLQVIVSVVILILLKKIFKLLCKHLLLNKEIVEASNYLSPGFLITTLITFFAIEFRMIGRPEMFSHLFTAIFIFILLKYHFEKSKIIWLLIPFQILWTNLHEGYGTGMVICIIATCGLTIQFLLEKVILKKSNSFDYKICMVLLFVMLSPAIHPYGIKMIWHPIEIYKQLSENKFTFELVNIFDPLYWNNSAYVNMLFFLIAAFFFLIKSRNEKSFLFKTGFVYPTIIVAFFVLSLTANRNIPFLILSVSPIVAIAFDNLLMKPFTIKTELSEKKKSKSKISLSYSFSYKRLNVALIILLLISAATYLFVVSDSYYKFNKSKYHFGMQVDENANPVGAAEFIRQHKISGVCFSDYLTSSFLLWNLRPGFKTFIDLRDLDIFPISFFSEFERMEKDTAKFNQMDSVYRFDYAVLFRPQFQSLHRHLVHGNTFALVYVDAVAAVYVRNNSRFANVIAQSNFNNGANDIFTTTIKNHSTAIAESFTKIFNPFFKRAEFNDVNFDAIAAAYYYDAGFNQLALKRIQSALEFKTRDAVTLTLAGSLYLAEMNKAGNSQQRVAMLSFARDCFNDVLKTDSTNSIALSGAAQVALNFGRRDDALQLLQKSFSIDASNSLTLGLLADLYEDLSKESPQQESFFLSERLKYLIDLNNVSPSNPYVMLQLAVSYAKLNNCKQTKSFLNRIKYFKNFDLQQQAELKSCLELCP